MIDAIAVTLRVLIELAGAALRPVAELLSTLAAPGAGALTAVAATAVIVALSLLAVALAVLLVPARTIAPASYPRRALHDTTRLTASHPDAPGHSRPRAPGFAALAA